MEILEYQEIKETHKSFEITGWEQKVVDPVSDKKSTMADASIANFKGHPVFNLGDADGSKIAGVKHGINTAKKFVDDVERLEIAVEEYRNNFDAIKYEVWKAEQIEKKKTRNTR